MPTVLLSTCSKTTLSVVNRIINNNNWSSLPFQRLIHTPPLRHVSQVNSLYRRRSLLKMDGLNEAQLDANARDSGSIGSTPIPIMRKTNGAGADAAGFASMTKPSPSNVQASHTAINPIDGYRHHIANLLAPITGVPADEIYPRLSWTQTLDKGDLGIAVPSLRLKGKKPNEQAEEFAAKVRVTVGFNQFISDTSIQCSFLIQTWLKNP